MVKNIFKTSILLTVLPWQFALADIDRAKEAYFMGDYDRSIAEFTPHATNGNSYAQIKLGFMAENGWGSQKDYVAARKWYQLAADANNPQGHIALAKLYAYGKGQSKNKELAEKHLLKAAGLNFPHAYYILGEINNDNYAFGHNEVAALKWYLKAAENNAAAHLRKGHFTEGSGIWFRLLKKEGVTLTRKAADEGNIYASFNTAIRYFYGEGVTKDQAIAKKYFSMAASGGIAEAQNYLNRTH